MSLSARSAYVHIAIVTSLVCLLVLIGTQSIWVGHGTSSNVMRQVGLQQTRIQAIAKDVMILRDEPEVRHTQAFTELQNVVPVWQQTQTGLLIGDESLGLPRYPPASIQLLVTQAQSSYTSILNACKIILSHSNPINSQEVDIVLDNEHTYAVMMNNVTVAWQQSIDDTFYQLFWIEFGLALVIFFCKVAAYILLKPVFKEGGD